MTPAEQLRQRKLSELTAALVRAFDAVPIDKLRIVVTALRDCGATEQEFGKHTWHAITAVVGNK